MSSVDLARAITRSRLAHFFVIGALIFAVAPRERGERVDLRSSTLAALRAAEAKREAAPLDPSRAHEVDARAIEDELLYREALRMSLDKGDPIVRQRLIERLLLLVEDMGGASRAPTEAELREHFDATHGDRRREDRIHFVHVFASRRDALPPHESLDPDARDAPAAGEAFPYPRALTATHDEIARVYGNDVAARLEVQDRGWSAPVASPFGWHRLRIVDRTAGAALRFEDVKDEIELDFVLARRERIVGRYLSELVAKYDIRVDGDRLEGFVPTHRVAIRSDPSGED
jgi:hypothetical protein